jgi:gamma-glutamyltranspeptidase
MQEAIAAPRVYYDHGNHRLTYEARIAKDTMEKTVRLLGGDSFNYSLVRKAPFDRYFGGAHGIWRQKVVVSGTEHMLLEGGADPRRDGVALGY